MTDCLVQFLLGLAVNLAYELFIVLITKLIKDSKINRTIKKRKEVKIKAVSKLYTNNKQTVKKLTLRIRVTSVKKK